MKNVREVSLVRIPATPWLLEYSLGEPMRAKLSSESLMILPFVELENIPLYACDGKVSFHSVSGRFENYFAMETSTEFFPLTIMNIPLYACVIEILGFVLFREELKIIMK